MKLTFSQRKKRQQILWDNMWNWAQLFAVASVAVMTLAVIVHNFNL